MRIFKNRGDIYFSKNNKEKSTEQKILLIALAVIVLFTFVFMLCVAAKNDFSIKKFFEPEDLSTTTAVEDSTVALPQVSGKTNYIVTVADNENLLFVELVQVDLDNKSYKICTLKSSTEYDGSTLGYIYAHSGVLNVKSATENMISTTFDYYIDFQRDKFTEYFDSLGSVNYALVSDIKYKNNKSAVPFTVRMKAGEQVIKGTQAVNLVRYFLETNNQQSVNDVLLTSLSKQINVDNFANKDSLFQDLVTKSNTNITVRDYSAADDDITVLCNSQNGISVYGAEVKYDKNKITKDTLQNAKGYFVK
ncbi:MAG: LCP family protein [Eubacterium sp.]|nr:LCP family protein [Eubacterium sp.]MDY4110211.1 LCP family protein [Eubacterium sp.]